MKRRGLAERTFRLVLWLYPAEFRDRFGHDMTSAYRAARVNAATRGRAGITAFWFGVALDALVRAPGEHLMMTLYDLRFAARALRQSPAHAAWFARTSMTSSTSPASGKKWLPRCPASITA